MKNNCFLGVDIGTYSAKGVLVDEGGRVLASHVVPHTIALPQPGWVEHDADGVWWGGFVAICRAVLAAGGVDPQRVAGVGVSTISPCVLPVDEEGRPLRPGILYGIDTRAAAEIGELEQALGADLLLTRYGTKLSAQATSPKIRWLRKHEPAVWRQTCRLLSGTGYIVYRLTGEATLDIYDAGAYAPLFDPQALAWNPELADLIAPVELLPRLTWTCDVAGRVTAAAAQVTGLAPGTPVITGTADAAAEAISAGLAQAGDLMVMYGSSIFFILKTDRLHRSERFWPTHFLEPGSYAVAGGMSTAGSLTRWFRDTLGQAEVAAAAAGGPDAYAALAALAATAPVGANGLLVLPYFAGERTPIHDPDARGVVCGLTLTHTRGDLYRALLEGVGYGIRHNLDVLRAEGLLPRRILAVGGGAQNRLWMELVSSSADIDQHLPREPIGAAYGDAILAAVGVGFFADTAAGTRWVEQAAVIRPDPAAREVYARYYTLYRDLYAATAPTLHALSALQRSGGAGSAQNLPAEAGADGAN